MLPEDSEAKSQGETPECLTIVRLDAWQRRACSCPGKILVVDVDIVDIVDGWLSGKRVGLDFITMPSSPRRRGPLRVWSNGSRFAEVF
jgi:hypothetical protein